MIDASYDTEIVRYDLSDPDIRLPVESKGLLDIAIQHKRQGDYVECLRTYYFLYQQVPCHPAMTFSLAKAFAAAGLTALAIRTFERTFQIADAMEEMDSGLRDYYLNESAMHVNDLKTDPEARLHYARTFARVPPALLAVFEVTKALAASRNDQLSEIDYLNRLFGDEGA